MADPISSFSGIASGMDYKALVAQILTVERRPAVKLEATVAANDRRKAQLDQFRTALEALRTAAAALGPDGTALGSVQVRAPGTAADGRTVLAATAATGAPPGSYAVTVTRLAAAQKTVGGVGLAPGALGLAGTLELKPGVAGAAVTIAATDDAASVRDKINATTRASGVQATLVTGDAGRQHLVLTGTQPGAANAFAPANASGTTDDLAGALGLSAPRTQVAAEDAALTVDGIAVTRPTNSVGDVIPGVTLALTAPGATAVTVEKQPGAATDALKAVADAYNKLQTFIKTQGAPRAPLANDSLLRAARGGLSGVVLGAAPTTDAGGQPTGVAADLATLGALGLSLTKDGTLQVDAARFNAASGARAGELSAALGQRMDALADYVEELTRPLTGVIGQRTQALDLQSARMSARVTDIDARLDKKRTQMLAQYAKFEASLGRLNAIGTSMSAQFAGLTRSNGDR